MKTTLGTIKGKAKTVPGKSAKDVQAPEYKPSLYLDGKQIPGHLKDAKPGDKVEMVAHGKVVSTSRRLGGQDSLSLEIHKLAPGRVKRKLFGKAKPKDDPDGNEG